MDVIAAATAVFDEGASAFCLAALDVLASPTSDDAIAGALGLNRSSIFGDAVRAGFRRASIAFAASVLRVVDDDKDAVSIGACGFTCEDA